MRAVVTIQKGGSHVCLSPAIAGARGRGLSPYDPKRADPGELANKLGSENANILRDRLAHRPHRWNAIRSRMKQVFARYRRRHPDLMAVNPWAESKRVVPPRSTQNRRWPEPVLIRVLRETTPEFRALVTTLLLTGQRAGDVVAFTPDQYDAATLLCEQVVGRALRRQSYDLNEGGPFNAEYADILGIPFDFAARPVVVAPTAPRETVRVQAMRDRAALRIGKRGCPKWT